LYLLVRPTGSKAWQFRYQFFGKEKLLSIGTYPVLSLADARKKRGEAKLSFAAHIRGVSHQALPLKFPFGHLEDMARMDSDDWEELRMRMRDAYAVHISELADVGVKPKGDGEEAGEDGKAPSPDDQAADETGPKQGKEPYKPKAKAQSRAAPIKKPRKTRKPPPKGDISEWKLELRTPKKGRSKDDPDHPDIGPKPDW
jgi:hypothetical protein